MSSADVFPNLWTRAVPLTHTIVVQFDVDFSFCWLNLVVIWSYPTHMVFVKVSKRSVVDMAFKPISKVAGPSETS